MSLLIPDAWREAVVAILRRDVPFGRVEVLQRPRRDWQAAFPAAFDYELLEALAQTFQNPTLGNRVFGMTPPGEIYECFFRHEAEWLYGKVGLHQNGLVIVFSAHIPLKGNSL